MIATRSLFATDSSTPRSTSTLRPTFLNVLTSPRASRTGTTSMRAPSLIAQRLGRRLPRCAQRRIERGGDGARERQAADLHDLEQPHLRGQDVEVIHLGRQQIDAEHPLQEIDDVSELPAQEQRE